MYYCSETLLTMSHQVDEEEYIVLMYTVVLIHRAFIYPCRKNLFNVRLDFKNARFAFERRTCFSWLESLDSHQVAGFQLHGMCEPPEA